MDKKMLFKPSAFLMLRLSKEVRLYINKYVTIDFMKDGEAFITEFGFWVSMEHLV